MIVIEKNTVKIVHEIHSLEALYNLQSGLLFLLSNQDDAIIGSKEIPEFLVSFSRFFESTLFTREQLNICEMALREDRNEQATPEA